MQVTAMAQFIRHPVGASLLAIFASKLAPTKNN